jgi:hypothetical protein
MNHFENLSATECQQLEDAVSLIAVLIAGADGKIDILEETWATKLAHIRSFAGEKWLHDFYAAVDANFNIKFHDLVKHLPSETAERQTQISEKLTHINALLAKLDSKTAYKLYTSYISFAKSIAEASGGFMRLGSIGAEEKKWLSLPMITPIENPENSEEEA